MTQTIIIYHRFTKEIEEQVIGRGQRIGRTEPLDVFYLIHENEKTPMKNDDFQDIDYYQWLDDHLLEEKEENEEIANFVISYGDHKDKRLIQLNEVELKKLYLSNEKLLKEIPPVKNVSEVFDTNQKIKKFLIQVECWPINFAEERV